MISAISAVDTVKPNWTVPENVTAFTTTRVGGVSEWPYDSLNLGAHVGDSRSAVSQNRASLRKVMHLPAEPVWLNQTHSTQIIKINDGIPFDTPPEADGAITSKPSAVCAVMTADCLPLFLCNASGTKVGVVHAGWRGMADGVIEQAIEAFDSRPEEVIAWAGPCISLAHFEVGEEVRVQLGGSDHAYCPSQNSGKWMASLNLLCEERLAKLGVTNYQCSKLCTYADQQRFFSHRRDGTGGRMVSIIYLR